MQDYVITYLEGMGYDIRFMTPQDLPNCELCRAQMHDVHHIDRRGMGGTKRKYFVEQMMAICRDHHTFFGDKKKYRAFLYWIHYLTMQKMRREIDFEKLPKDIFFDQYSEEQKVTSVYYSIIMNRGYIEEIEEVMIENRLKIEITIKTANNKKITNVIGFDKYELIKTLIQLL